MVFSFMVTKNVSVLHLLHFYLFLKNYVFLGIKPLNFKFLVILEAPALFDATRSSLLYLVNHRLSADIIKE